MSSMLSSVVLRLRFLLFDVDGVLTDGRLFYLGDEVAVAFDVRDGVAVGRGARRRPWSRSSELQERLPGGRAPGRRARLRRGARGLPGQGPRPSPTCWRVAGSKPPKWPTSATTLVDLPVLRRAWPVRRPGRRGAGSPPQRRPRPRCPRRPRRRPRTGRPDRPGLGPGLLTAARASGRRRRAGSRAAAGNPRGSGSRSSAGQFTRAVSPAAAAGKASGRGRFAYHASPCSARLACRKCCSSWRRLSSSSAPGAARAGPHARPGHGRVSARHQRPEALDRRGTRRREAPTAGTPDRHGQEGRRGLPRFDQARRLGWLEEGGPGGRPDAE